MAYRADAHIHLFDGGFGYSFTARQGVRIDETACYESLQKTHDVRDALVVGYAAEPWCQSNNNFLARITRDLPWAHPTAYIDLTDPLTADHLKRLQADGFVGISIYCFDEKTMTAIEKTNTDTWQWLVEHRWLISVNSRGHYWSAWESVLQKHKQLRVLVSHLGLPQKVSSPPDTETARASMATVLALADYEQVHIKVSGFYGIGEPAFDYPHEPVWPYVQLAHSTFGSSRLLWGSDFSPHLDSISFPQTFDHFRQMSFLSDDDRTGLEGQNLTSLLRDVITG